MGIKGIGVCELRVSLLIKWQHHWVYCSCEIVSISFVMSVMALGLVYRGFVMGVMGIGLVCVMCFVRFVRVG